MGIKHNKAQMKQRLKAAVRHKAIYEEAQRTSQRAVARRLGISDQRVHQIVQKYRKLQEDLKHED